jgi:hypothetical protein
MTEDETIYTRILSIEEVETALLGLPDLLVELAGGACMLSAEYGCCCNIHNDLQYVPMRVGIKWLQRFLAESKEQSIYVPGKSALKIMTPNGGLTILFCDEGDIHLSGQDEKLIERAANSELIRPLLKK